MAILAPRRITRTADHQYGYEGKWYPGVTGVLKVLDKSGPLIRWSANNTAEAAIDLLAELPAMLETVGRQGVIKALAERGTKKRDEAALIGTDIHTLADLIVRGQDIGSPPEHLLNRAKKYAEWWATEGWVLRASEAMLINPKDGYGGTLDLLCYDRDRRTVLADVKTGKGVYMEAVLQLRAYGDATYIETDQGFFGMPQVDRYVILHVTEAGVRPIEVPMTTLEEVAWIACLDLHQWRQTQKGRSL